MTIISGVGNTVANMADAMDTTDACTLAIEVKQGPKSLINIISTYEMKMMLSEMFDVVSKDLLSVRISVLWECFICKMLGHIALLRNN